MPPSRTPGSALPPVIIKKYANRRLYDTESSSYITLEHLAAMTREGREFKVVDARSGEDITRSVLTQIIMEQENGEQTMLPVPFLRQLIGLYGNSMQAMVPVYLEASMDALKKNQEQIREAMTQPFAGTPFEALAKQNFAMFEKAAEMFAPKRGAEAGEGAAKPDAAAPAAGGADEVSDLKQQLAALQAKLEKLGS
jgi:polyhydroxyalkanoate synthesis repressor PhaR